MPRRTMGRLGREWVFMGRCSRIGERQFPALERMESHLPENTTTSGSSTRWSTTTTPTGFSTTTGPCLTALKAIKDGKVRYLGFTGHKDPVIHLKMLSKPYEWATAQMPLNVMDAHYRSFQHNVLPEAGEARIGPLGMKSLGGAGKIVSEAGVSIEDALRYVLSLPIAALVSGIDSSEKVLEQNLKIVRNFTPLSEDEKDRNESSVMKLAGDGRFELFKSSQIYDGPVHRKQHGFDIDTRAV